MNEITSFGEWVQARRNQLKLSRTEMARRIGCAPVTIKKIERDERRPSPQIAELLAQHLRLPDTEHDDFMRRARGEFVARFGQPAEMSLAEAQAPTAEEDAPKHNLPPQTTPFFGRRTELAKIGEQLAQPTCRLLTILGAGGMGKTRLSLAAATIQLDNFTDGVTYVELAPVAETAAINPLVGALADALKISFHGGDTPEQQLFTYLRRKEMLIVFDNVEHLVDSAVFLSHLLAHAPDIKILTTSRERLNLQEEWLFPLQGLSYSAGETSAMQLFAQRAQQVKVDFDLAGEETAVFRICQLVEGMPLGLELAASWVLQLSCIEIADEIEAELDFLTTNIRNVPKRQRSIRAVFSNSWDKLSAKEQAVLQKLSVFRGGFERKAAKEIAGASLSLLASLVGKSLLSVDENGSFGSTSVALRQAQDGISAQRLSTPRYQIHELLRQFAAEKLEQRSEAQKEAQDRHCHYFLTLVGDQGPKIHSKELLLPLTKLREDIDNIRIALTWGAAQHQTALTATVGRTLYHFFEIQGWYLEGESLFRLIAKALKPVCDANFEHAEQTSLPSACLHWAVFNTYLGWTLFRLTRLQEAEEAARQSLAIFPANPAEPLVQSAKGSCLGLIAGIKYVNGSLVQPETIFHECAALFAQSDETMYAWILTVQGQARLFMGDYDQAQALLEESEQRFLELGERYFIGKTRNGLAFLAQYRGKFDKAKAYVQAVLTQSKKIGYPADLAMSLYCLGEAERLQGNFEKASRFYHQSIATADESNVRNTEGMSTWALGNLAVTTADFAAAERYFEESGLVGRHSQGTIGGLGWVALGLGEPTKANRYFQASLKHMLDTGMKPLGLDAFVGIATLDAQAGQLTRAIELLALVRDHPASHYEIQGKARQLWDELVAELPLELVAEAKARGQGLDLWETAVSHLA